MPVYRVPVSLSYAGPGSPGVNVLHIRTAGVPLEGDTERENAMVAIRNFYASTSLLYHASTVIRFPTELVDVEDNEIVSVAARNEISGAGTATVMLPPASCICVSWKSSSATRAGRGRTFLGGGSPRPCSTPTAASGPRTGRARSPRPRRSSTRRRRLRAGRSRSTPARSRSPGTWWARPSGPSSLPSVAGGTRRLSAVRIADGW